MAEELDVETLQAQIDLSNSIAYDIVSSWMKPTPSSSNTESVSKTIARDLEENAKRPLRLGLGAAVSKSSIATSREAARLKGKLTGTKRARSDGMDSASTPGAGQSKVDEDAEDEDESRSAAISTKKIKVNGTGGLSLGIGKKYKGKSKEVQAVVPKGAGNGVVVGDEGGQNKRKRKRKNHEINSHDSATSDDETAPLKLNPFVLPSIPGAPTFLDQSIIDPVSPSPARPVASTETPSPSKKKKKKKHRKKKKDKSMEDDSAPLDAEEWTGFSNRSPELIQSTDIPDASSSTSAEATHLPSTPPPHASNAPKPSLPTPSSVVGLVSPTRPTPSPPRGTQINLHSPAQATLSPTGPLFATGQPIPLLNLQRPPLDDVEMGDSDDPARTENESPKRKRPKRRRGKGKKTYGGGKEAE